MSDNEFLNNVRIEQFITNSTSSITSTIESSTNALNKTASDLLKTQKTSLKHLVSLDKKATISNTKLEMSVKRQDKLYKIIDKYIKSVTKDIKSSSKNKSEIKKERNLINTHHKENMGKLDDIIDGLHLLNNTLSSLEFGGGGGTKEKEEKEQTKERKRESEKAKKESSSIAKIVSSIKGPEKTFRKTKNWDKLNNNQLKKLNKKMGILGDEKKKGGFLKGIGGLIAKAGILGFLLTGNVNMLAPLARVGGRFMDFLFKKPLKSMTSWMGKKMAKIFGKEGAEAVAKTTTKTIGKEGGELAAKKIAQEATESLTKKVVTKEVAKTATKKAVTKTAAKSAGKGLFKTLANNIPVVGTLVSLPFAINRAMKGDWVGAGMEIAAGSAGALNAIPGLQGVGTAVGWGLEGALLARDVKHALDGASTTGNTSNTPKKTTSNTHKADPIPPLIGKGHNKVRINGTGIPKYTVDLNTNTLSKMTRFNPSAETSSYIALDDVNLSGMNGDVWNNFSGMFDEYHRLMSEQHPGYKNKFGLDGSYVQINSGYRSLKEQQQLWEDYVASGYTSDPAAEPGKSMHNYGYAMDINSPEANIMAGQGDVTLKVNGSQSLFEKWGFFRPMGAEPWHIEPKGLDYSKARAGIDTQFDSPRKITTSSVKRADPVAVSGNGLPKRKLTKTIAEDDKPISVVLSKEDMRTLANEIGHAINNKIPKPPTSVSSNNNTARSVI